MPKRYPVWVTGKYSGQSLEEPMSVVARAMVNNNRFYKLLENTMNKKVQMLGGLLLLGISSPSFAENALVDFSTELLSTIVYSAVGILMGCGWI